MKLAVIRISNGSFNIERSSEDKTAIMDKYYELCRSYNTTPNINATVDIVDENLDSYEGGKYKKHFVNVTPAQNQSE